MSAPSYRRVDPQIDFPELERAVLERWRTGNIFHRSLEQRRAAPEWVFYEGPPTANGKPGIHHVEARVFKDIFCRFRTMTGHYVHRKAGWDCHGLPVEIEVEKELGIKQKRDIEEKIGIEEFVRRCRGSVTRYVDEWERFTDRLGFWVDLDDAYWTMDADYVESVWWLLKQIWDKGLLEEDFKVVPYCPRCETALSSHEQHQTGAYRTVSDPSVYVRYPFVDEPDVALLVWTTTPWTLLANLAAAVGPDITYAEVADPAAPGRRLVVAAERVAALFGDDVRAGRTFPGRELLGRRYSPPYPFVPTEGAAHTVRSADFVTIDDGTGIVHLAPYGEDDVAVAKRDGIPLVQMIDASGRVVGRGAPFGGLWIKDADPKIVADLEERALLFRAEVYEHAYPHCWRCGTPLLYYPRKDWYIRTSQIRAELQASNEETNWQPPTIKHGRFGDWLANNVDWSLSRDRYWGTPLPIWRCADEHVTCIGSFAELAELSGQDLSDLDPHRPYVDRITFSCPQCSKPATRLTYVIDAWFDSGSMPFAQWHYPFENEASFERRFPADFISEAVDQTRGWFYSLLAVATLVKRHNSYRNVVCLGHLIDVEGRKMSKSLGNVLDPWLVMDNQGSDALRWYMLTAGTPWSPRRVSVEIVQEALRKFLLTLWNIYAFWVTYAAIESFDPIARTVPLHERSQMDRWILAELDDTVRIATEAMQNLDATHGGRRIDRFVDDLSNWYVRRSRRRFWRSSEEADTRAAFVTLWECLVTVSKLIAPYTPFIADEIYTNLTQVDATAHGSVHLESWPEPVDERSDDALRRRMAIVRKLVALGRAARTEARVRVRQPLSRALLVMPSDEAPALADLESLVLDELNVKELKLTGGFEELVHYSVKPNFKALGPRFGPKVKDIARALAAADPKAVVAALDQDGAATVEVDGDALQLVRDDLDVRVEGHAGYSLAQDGPYGVALELHVTPELHAEGIARELVREIQELRKSSGLAVEDRIELWLAADDDRVRAALEAHREFIAAEVLAVRLRLGEPTPADASSARVELDHGRVDVAVARRA